MSKRKSHSDEEDQYFSALEVDLKRVKISCTPGELRLYRDIDELQGRTEAMVVRGDLPSTAFVTFPVYNAVISVNPNFSNNFTNQTMGSMVISLPSRFIITVPRYYPHRPPSVRCIDPELTSNPYIDGDGTVHHPDFSNSWTPIKSLTSVMMALQDIRAIIAQSWDPYHHHNTQQDYDAMETTSTIPTSDSDAMIIDTPPILDLGS